jgi:hypothetical protein
MDSGQLAHIQEHCSFAECGEFLIQLGVALPISKTPLGES